MELLQKVPSEVWAAITASLITLGGISLSNRHARKQQKEALTHDERQRDKEREMSLRREVYLDAAEAISNGLSDLGRMINLEISDQDINSESSKNSAAIAKVNMVATNPTVQAVSNYYSEFNSTYLELFFERLLVMERKNSIDDLSNLIQKNQSEIDRWIEMMKTYNLEGKHDERKWKGISQNLEFHQKNEEELIDKRDNLRTIQQKELFSFTGHFIDKMRFISSLIPPAIFAVRKELSLPIDEEAYLKNHMESLARIQHAAENFLSKIKQRIDSQ